MKKQTDWATNKRATQPAKENTEMETMVQFVALILTTLIALFAALALDWLLLRGMFLLMQPATADRRAHSAGLERGAQLAARAYRESR
jgi:hypothetical protein